MNELRLKDVTKEVIRGIAVRPPKSPDVPVQEVINIKDLHDGLVDVTSLDKRELIGKKDTKAALLKEGDILIAAKGAQFKVAVADRDTDGHIISSNLIALRLDMNKVIPEVVSAYLNSPMGQHNLSSKSKGSNIPSINQKDLLETLIPVPPMERQLALKEYLKSVNGYLLALEKEEQIIRNIRNYIIFQHLGARL